MKKLLYLFLLPLMIACDQKIEDPLESLQEKELHSLNLNLYPSNLRMINSNNDPDFAEATKDIEKMHILQIKLEDEAQKASFLEWENAQDFKKWESIFSARMDQANISVWAPEGRDDIIYASVKTGDAVYVGFLEGKIDISMIPKLMKSDLNLGPISDFLGDKKKKEAQREKYRKMRDEAKAAEEVQDSIK